MNKIDIERMKNWLKKKQSNISSEEYREILKQTEDYINGEDMNKKTERKIRKLIEAFNNHYPSV